METITSGSNLSLVQDEHRYTVDCDAYIANVTNLIVFNEDIHIGFEFIVEKVAIPIVATFGIIGNVMNLVVLTRKRLQHSMDRMEKSANMGLVTLAVSDLVVCLIYLLRVLIGNMVQSRPGHSDVRLFFKVYEEALLNIALLCSTWLTVTMAISRYLAVCRPLDARGRISLRGTRLTLTAVFVCSVACNLPRFWMYRLVRLPCPLLEYDTDPVIVSAFERCHCFYDSKEGGIIYSSSSFPFWYGLGYSLVSMFVPLPVLTVCNVRLVQALRRSLQLQKQHCRSSAAAAAAAETNQHAQHRITPTLIGLIVLFLVLVGPSEIMAFVEKYVIARALQSMGNQRGYEIFQTAIKITNFLQLANFAVNFILYCVVNIQFRRATRQLLRCSLGNKGNDNNTALEMPLERFSKSNNGRNQSRHSKRVIGTVTDVTAI